MKKCPVCQTENSDDTKFCKNCGINISHTSEQSTAVNYPKVRCPICGALNITSRRYCSDCGQPLTQEAANQLARGKTSSQSQKKPNGCLKAFLITALVCVILFIIIPVIFISISGYLKSANNAAASVSSHNAALTTKSSTMIYSEGTTKNTTTTTAPIETIAPIAKIGERIDVGKVSYVVEKVETANTAGGEYINATAKGTYLLVTISITNNSSDPLTISDTFFTILNGEKKYSADSVATMYADSENSLWYDSLNPDLTTTGIVAFDVTDEVATSADTQLQVQTGFWGTQTGIISLSR